MSARGGTFTSLGVRNYRFYWSVQLLSQLGTWMRLIAISWLVLTDLDGGGTAVGLLTATQFAPTLVLGAWAGLLADRGSPLNLLRGTWTAIAAIEVVLVVLVATDTVELWMVFALTACVGLATAFGGPARLAVVSELVPPELVPNAVALNSMGFNGARIVGPALAGVLIQFGGTQLCFLVDAVLCGLAVLGLLAVDRTALFPRERVERAKGQVREGLRYAASVPVLRTALLTMAVVGTVSMNFTVLVPLLAEAFTSSAATFGLMSTAMGVGSFVGAAFAARRSAPRLRHLAAASGAVALGLAGVAAAPGFAMAAAALAFTGASVITFLATTNSLLQVNARSDMRGRVLALYMVLVVGTSPFGAPLIGWIAETRGVRTSVAVAAVGALLGAVVASSVVPKLALRRGARRAVGKPAAPAVAVASLASPEDQVT